MTYVNVTEHSMRHLGNEKINQRSMRNDLGRRGA